MVQSCVWTRWACDGSVSRLGPALCCSFHAPSLLHPSSLPPSLANLASTPPLKRAIDGVTEKLNNLQMASRAKLLGAVSSMLRRSFGERWRWALFRNHQSKRAPGVSGDHKNTKKKVIHDGMNFDAFHLMLCTNTYMCTYIFICAYMSHPKGCVLLYSTLVVC